VVRARPKGSRLERGTDASANSPPPPAAAKLPAVQTQPVESRPEPPLDDLVFVADEATPVIASRYGRRARRRRMTSLAVSVCLLALCGGAAYLAWQRLAPALHWADLTGEEPPVQGGKQAGANSSPAAAGYPRRALALCIHNYLYANPVGYGTAERNVHTLMERLARVLHISPTQVAELSDAVPPQRTGSARTPGQPRSSRRPAGNEPLLPMPMPRPPLKGLIEESVTRFLSSCRPQDCALLLFIGHAIVLDGTPYLVPVEGDLGDKATLIPLAWLYDRLHACPARQKVLLLDTCRLDPARGQERPGSGPMDPKLADLLATPPEGVQVWSACSAGEYCYEYDGTSLFLEQLGESLTGKALPKSERPEDPLPIKTLAEVVDPIVGAEVETQLKSKQTPRLAGKEPGAGTVEKNATPPRSIEIPAPPPPSGGMAKPAQVRRILAEIELPPIRLAREETAPLEIDRLLPFSDHVLEAYRADYDTLEQIEEQPAKYPLRIAVLKTIRLLRDRFSAEHATITLRESFAGGGSSERTKAAILREQAKPARLELDLEEALEEMRAAGKERGRESSKRWQTHYDYILAQLLARIAYVHEYNLMLGKIRKDELPELTPGVHTGYRLSSQEKLQSPKEVRDLAAEARTTFTRIAHDNAGTPWEILARRARLTALGLRWEPTRS
jgi:hypothetical protein